MKTKKLITFVAFVFISFNIFCQEIESSKSLSVDFAYYPKSDFIAGGPSHFAPLTGAYSGLEGRVKGSLNYTIPTPLGENWLLSSANLGVQLNLELTPVSIAPESKISFTPLPFLVFETGAKLGTGWNLAGLQGMAVYDGDEGYNDLIPFNCWFAKFYVQGTFQFDTGALVPGDWTHLQFMYTYQAYYAGLSSVRDGEIWEWQCSINKTNGWQNYQNIVLAYQMPLTLSRIGVLTEIDGHYKNDCNMSDYEYYNGTFKAISISPLMQFTLPKNQNLTILLGFSSRRSFTEPHVDSKIEPQLTYAGREWYFNRIAFSWSMSF